MSSLKSACEEIYEVIYDDIKRFCEDNHHDITEEEFIDEIIEKTYNDDETFTKTDSYNSGLLSVKNMFEILKCVSKITKEEYGYEFEIDTIEKTIDLYAYLCAKEIAYKMIEEFDFKEENESEESEEEEEKLEPAQ